VCNHDFLGVTNIYKKKVMKHNNTLLKVWCCIFLKGIGPFPFVKIKGSVDVDYKG